VKIGTETKSGPWTLKTTGQRSFFKVNKTDVDESEVYDLTIEPTYTCADSGITVEAKVQTQNVNSVLASKNDLGLKGLKVSAGYNQTIPLGKAAADIEQTINLGANFQHENLLRFKVNVGVPVEASSSRAFPIDGHLVVSPVDNVHVGVKYNLNYTTGEESKLEKKIEFKIAGVSGATRGHVTGSLDRRVGAFGTHKLNDDDQVGLAIRAEFPEDKTKFSKLSIDVAGSHKVCKDSTLGAKFNFEPTMGNEKAKTGIRLGLGFVYNLPNTNASATLAADVNIASLLGTEGQKPHSLGFELKLK
jgi:hypothetical protein